MIIFELFDVQFNPALKSFDEIIIIDITVKSVKTVYLSIE